MATAALLFGAHNPRCLLKALCENGVTGGSRCRPPQARTGPRLGTLSPGTDGRSLEVQLGVALPWVTQCRRGGPPAEEGYRPKQEGGPGAGGEGAERKRERPHSPPHVLSQPPHAHPVLWGLPGPEMGKKPKSGVAGGTFRPPNSTLEQQLDQTQALGPPSPLSWSHSPGRRADHSWEISGLLFGSRSSVSPG